MQSWTGWKRFPDSHNRELVEAPIGPGVYEVRHADTGEVIAFGSRRQRRQCDLASSRSTAMPGCLPLFHRSASIPVSELEYRTCATASLAEAKIAAKRLPGAATSKYWQRSHLRSAPPRRPSK